MMTLHAPLVGLRSFCELPWPFQFACGQAWAEGAGLTALSKDSTCRPGGGGGRDHFEGSVQVVAHSKSPPGSGQQAVLGSSHFMCHCASG